MGTKGRIFRAFFNPVDGPELIPDFVPGNVIDIQFLPGTQETTQEERAFFLAARDEIEACFNTNPIVHNGSDKITITFRMDNTLGGGTIAVGGTTSYRADNTTFTGMMRFNPIHVNLSQSNRSTFFHEMVHALGMVRFAPRYEPFRVDNDTPNAGWQGPLAVAAFNAMPGAPGGQDRVPVPFPASAHWVEQNDHNIPGDCFQNELMSPSASGTQSFSPVTAGAIRDMGYDFNMACDIVDTDYVCGQL